MSELAEKLFMTKKNAYLVMEEAEIKKAYDFCEDYKKFLDNAKTEREAVNEAVKAAKANGFTEYNPQKAYVPGDKVYVNNRGKAAIFAVIGKKGVKEGALISAAHIDSPRLDLKPIPLYEKEELAFLKTHYYGGIKKYQWTAMPLSMHGVIVKKNGEKVEVAIGENENDPVFCITDLLPHLSADQNNKTLAKAIEAEDLNILVGSMPLSDEAEKAYKINVLKLLNDAYGIVEEDLVSAEIEFVPAFKAKDVGFDRSLIGSYGHDDRVCAYPILKAVLDVEIPEKTVISIFADKEETGSDGNTGLNSSYLKYFIEDLAKGDGIEGREALSKSKCLSADVTAALDPTYASAYEPLNACYINHGVGVHKYTGARGKGGTSDASAEFVGEVRKIFNDNGVMWQICELGKVDLGGGGTVAKYVANLNVDVIDVGVPVLSMHAPYEVVAKTDVFMAYKAVCAFFKAD